MKIASAERKLDAAGVRASTTVRTRACSALWQISGLGALLFALLPDLSDHLHNVGTPRPIQ